MWLEPAQDCVQWCFVISSDEYSGYTVRQFVAHCVENLTEISLERMSVEVCTVLYNTLLLLHYINFCISYKQHSFSVLCYLVWSIIKRVNY
jgi:hypothetical protein